MTVLVKVETVEEQWDGAAYAVTAGVAGGMDDLLKNIQLVQKDRQVEQELVLASGKADAVLQEIDDLNRELRETGAELAKMHRYSRCLDELEALNGCRRGLALLAGGRFREAVEALTESINQDPNGARLHHYRGVAHPRMGNQSGALTDCDQAITLDRRYAAPHLGCAEILFVQGHWEKALGPLQAAFAIDPSFTEAYVLRGVSCIRRSSCPAWLHCPPFFGEAP